jgi:thiosulfate dehydrogenase
MIRAMLIVIMLWATLACQPPTGAEVGESLVADPRLSDSDFNGIACTTCHDGRTTSPRIASPLAGMASRSSWWGGQSPRLIDAVNFCATSFMRATPMEGTAPRWRAVDEYLLAQAGTAAASATMTIIENVTTVNTGSSSRGRQVWDASCRVCHGDPHTGTGRIADTVATVPEASIEYAAESGFPPALVVIEKVRHGAFFGVGGSMPPFSLEALSDDDLGALLGYLDL